MMPNTTISEIEDRFAIRETLYGYARGADTRDWDLFRDCFLDEVEIDLSSWNGAPASVWTRDEWVANVRQGLSGFDATQHLTANHLIENSLVLKDSLSLQLLQVATLQR